MKWSKVGERRVETLTADEKKRIRNAMMYRFGAYLRPGETISLEAEKSDEFVYGMLSLEAADDSIRVDLEASILAADQGVDSFVDPGEALDVAFEFLKMRLYDFFQQDRAERFHIDWRHYDISSTDVRFRGKIRRPELEDRADDLLDEQEALADEPLPDVDGSPE